MVCYFKRICGINQADDRVTWPDLLHRHTIALASFREWSVVSARLRIRAQPRNPCRARNSASAWTCWNVRALVNTGSRLLRGAYREKMASPKWRRFGSGSERKLHENMLITYSLLYIYLIFMANNIKICFWFTIQSVWALLKLRLRQKSSGKWDEKSSHEM